jgi:hypothetical protein
LGDQIRLACITGLGEMHLIADPVSVPRTKVADQAHGIMVP